MTAGSTRHHPFCALAAVACVVAMPAAAQAQARSFALDIPAQTMSSALKALAAATGQQVVFRGSVVRGKRSVAIRGRYAVDEAVSMMIGGSGLSASRSPRGVIVIAPATQPTAAAPPAPKNDDGTGADIVVTATGTRIRGGGTASPVIAIDAKRIRQEGFNDLGEVIRSLPQNFSGGQNPGIGAGATGGGRSNQNITGGSGLNLRGLGQDASLTLLNGRRMAYGGFVQMVDISALPVEAVDRIEILADGASAIYGSDAVGGVANVILKRDFDGLAASARYGFATDGGLATQDYSATAGATWASGGVIATFKTVSNDPVRADQRSYTEAMFAPSTLYQRGNLYSGLVSAHQALGDRIELRVDGLLSRRKILTDLAYAATYERNEPTTRTRFIAPNMDIALPHGWLLSIGGAWGKDETKVDYRVITRATGAAALSRPSYDNESITYEVGAEGPLFALGGGDVRLAVGAGYRRNDYLSTNLVSGAITVDGKVSSRFAYGELNLPLIGPDQGIGAIHRLTVTGALRIEDYASLSTVSTPKFGLIYQPTEDVTLKASWGRSFKVPTLSQQFSIQNAILFPAVVIGGSGFPADATALYHVGGNPDLKPERAETWSGSVNVHPRALPGFEAELTWFDIDYTNRVVQPLVPAQALSNPNFAPFIQYDPSATYLAEIIASATFVNGAGVPYDASKVVALASNIFINTARERARGFDLSGSYRFDVGNGRLMIRGSISWLDISRRISSAESAFDLTGTLYYPAKLSARAGAAWQQDGFSASVFGNHRGGVTNAADGIKGGSFTTFDTTLRYDLGETGIVPNLAFELSAQNLFDKAPPLFATTSLTNTPYDSTNYSAVGRFLSFAISKRF